MFRPLDDQTTRKRESREWIRPGNGKRTLKFETATSPDVDQSNPVNFEELMFPPENTLVPLLGLTLPEYRFAVNPWRPQRPRFLGVSRVELDSTESAIKKVNRLYGLFLIFAAELPSASPSFVSAPMWAHLQQLSRMQQLVSLQIFSDDAVRISFPEIFDTIIHSRVNYGPGFVNHRHLFKTRSRWWSDCFLGPFGRLQSARQGSNIVHTISLPPGITSHPRLAQMFRNPNQGHLLCQELASFFEMLLCTILSISNCDCIRLSAAEGLSTKLLKSFSLTDVVQVVLHEKLKEWDELHTQKSAPDLCSLVIPSPFPPLSPSFSPYVIPSSPIEPIDNTYSITLGQ